MSYQHHVTRIGIVAVALSMHLLGCAGNKTHVEQSWTAPDARYVQFHRVAALFVARDGALRRSAEDKMSRELARRGVQAIPAYTILTDQDVQDFNQARQKLVAAGVDGVVAMRPVDKEQHLVVMPATFDAYWGSAWPVVWDPGYAYTETIVRMETNVYSVPDNKLVYSAVSKTVDPGNSRKLIDDVTKLVARELERRRLVAPPTSNYAGRY